MSKPSTTAEMKKHTGLRLRAAREVLGIRTHEGMAGMIGSTRTAVSNWENGIRMPDIMAMMRLATVSDITLEWIFLGALKSVGYEIGHQLEAKAAELGAAVNAPTPEWPMAVERAPRPRRLGAVPAPRPVAGHLHEPPIAAEFMPPEKSSKR